MRKFLILRLLGIAFCFFVEFCAFAQECGVPAPDGVVRVDSTSPAAFAKSADVIWSVPLGKFLAACPARWEIAGAASENARTSASAYWSGREIFGIGAEQVRVEAEKGVPVRLEIMFFNKGDSAARAGMGHDSGVGAEQKERFSENAWRDCLARVEAVLDSLGERRRCSIGGGKLRRRALAWKSGETAFVLDAQKNEFVRVLVVPVSRFAELTSSAVERVKSVGKLSENIERRGNGDVFIKNIPMVNQGDKGYCLPATLERVLRYYGVAGLDMHKIAELADTGVGGGTAMEIAVKNLAPVVKKNRLAFASQKMNFSKIRQSVERGIPLIWVMYSTPKYDERLRVQTRERLGAEDFSAWTKQLNAQSELEFSSEEARKYGHVCLIIGYNSKSKELCVSNSWGDFAREQWVRFEDAETVSAGTRLYQLKN